MKFVGVKPFLRFHCLRYYRSIRIKRECYRSVIRFWKRFRDGETLALYRLVLRNLILNKSANKEERAPRDVDLIFFLITLKLLSFKNLTSVVRFSRWTFWHGTIPPVLALPKVNTIIFEMVNFRFPEIAWTQSRRYESAGARPINIRIVFFFLVKTVLRVVRYIPLVIVLLDISVYRNRIE